MAKPQTADPATAQLTPDRLKKRRDNARVEYDRFGPMRDDAYRYAIPYRKSTKDSGAGEKRVDQVFDHTAIDAGFRFAGKLQQDVWPTDGTNFQLEPGPVVPASDKEGLVKELDLISKTIAAYFEDPDWGLAFHEMAIDLCAGTGAMLMNPSDEPGKLWEPMSVPIEELMLEGGANGKISGVFWDRKMPVRVLFETWPDGEFGERLKKLNEKSPEREITVHHDTVRTREPHKAARWHAVIWCDEQKDAPVHKSESRTCPWLLPRYFRVAGETYGRGLVMLAMPSIKTVNTAARLQLQAAAIAMLGIYTATDDGVFNPDLSPIAPGVFWKVGRNAGTNGPTVSRFPDPRVDLAQLVVSELRQGVRSTMMDDDLPLSSEAVKSPTEIVERIKKSAANHMGAFERLVKEITVPAVMRVIELAFNAGLIRYKPNIDNLLLRLKINSPLAVARAASRVQRNLEWLQTVIMVESSKTAAPGIARIARTDDLLMDAGRKLGVDEAFITTPEQRKQIDEDMAKQQAAAVALAAVNGKAPATA